MEFPINAGGYKYRPLKLGTTGWDVFALQTALNGVGDDLVEDGEFGAKTQESVHSFQLHRRLTPVDNIAGVATQLKLAQVLGRKFREGWNLLNGMPYGHIEKESSGWLGNYTAPYDDGSRDFGIVQRNSNFTPMKDGFDAPASLMALCQRIHDKHEEYAALVPSRRAWELACGSWNAPAWTDALARGDTIAPANRTKIEAYIDAVTTYVKWT